MFYSLKTKSKQNSTLGFLGESVVFDSCKYKPQMLLHLPHTALPGRTPKSLLSHFIKGWFLASRFQIYQRQPVLEYLPIMLHKRVSLSKVLCSETVHTCFSLCSSDGLINLHLYKTLKTGLCKHFRLAHPPVAEYSELFLPCGFWSCGRARVARNAGQ